MKGLLVFIEMMSKNVLYLNENKQPVHMRYHSFLQYGWFLLNLGKDFIQTNMHTTEVCNLLLVSKKTSLKVFKQYKLKPSFSIKG